MAKSVLFSRVTRARVKPAVRKNTSRRWWVSFSRVFKNTRIYFMLARHPGVLCNDFAMWCSEYTGRVKQIWYLSPMRAAKVQASLRIRAVSPEPPLLAHTSSESRGTFRQNARSLAPLNGWACAVKICHNGMLEDTNLLDGAHTIPLTDLTVGLSSVALTRTKPTKWLCAQRRLRSAWASAQSDQSLCCPHEESRGP